MDTVSKEKSGALVPVLACVLNQLCVGNDQVPFSPKESNSKFHALRIPCINLTDYLERIAKYSGCSTESLVLALVYIDRIIQCSQNFVVNSYCIHRLLITSVMLAAKFFDDHYYNNAYYANVGGVSYTEMNALEVEFLFMLNFDLFVTTETYKKYYDELWNHANNSTSHLCGCNKAKVPPLILPRFDEPRKTQIVLNNNDSDLMDTDTDLDIEDDSSLPPSTPEMKSISSSIIETKNPIVTTTTATRMSITNSIPMVTSYGFAPQTNTISIPMVPTTFGFPPQTNQSEISQDLGVKSKTDVPISQNFENNNNHRNNTIGISSHSSHSSHRGINYRVRNLHYQRTNRRKDREPNIVWESLIPPVH